MTLSVSAGTAFLAGIASFLSPCVLPLVPGYISFLSGLSLEELSRGAERRNVLAKGGLSSLSFVLGFSLVFTALGASASALGRLMAENLSLLSKLAGVLIMLFGLHMTGLLPIPWLYYEKRLSPGRFASGLGGSFLMGLAFACGWTPCIGPILASILALAAVQETVGRGMLLLFSYSLGLGIPFLLSGLAVNACLQFLARYKRYIRWGEVAAGALLIVVGALVASNRLTWLIRYLPKSLFKFAL